MSFALTTRQVLEHGKDITRRMGWQHVQPGERLQPVLKCQGLKAGEKVTRVGGPVRVVSVRRESLGLLLDDPQGYGRQEVDREGFPDRSVTWFVEMFMRANKCGPRAEVTRIEFAYEDHDNGDDADPRRGGVRVPAGAAATGGGRLQGDGEVPAAGGGRERDAHARGARQPGLLAE